MIYRLWNEAKKQYATEEQLEHLHVNCNGAVEYLYVGRHSASMESSAEHIYLIDRRPAPEWVVEWGIKHGIVNVFVNDVLKIWEWKCDEEPELNDFHFVKVVWSNEYYMPLIYDKALEYEEAPLSYALETYVSADNFVDPYFEVVGNIHDNPELLEDK